MNLKRERNRLKRDFLLRTIKEALMLIIVGVSGFDEGNTPQIHSGIKIGYNTFSGIGDKVIVSGVKE